MRRRLVGVLVSLVCACSDTAQIGGSEPPDPPEPIAQPEPPAPQPAIGTVGEDGGSLVFSGGTLTVPAGATDDDVVVSVVEIHLDTAPLEDAADAESALEIISPVYLFEPEGQTFAVPLEVRFLVSQDVEAAAVFWSRSDGEGYERLGGEYADGALVVYVTHFSRAFVARAGPKINSAGVAVCLARHTLCGPRCVDTRVDARHCGGCDDPCTKGVVCNSGQCADYVPPCVPECASRECGSDGCGGVCGTCGPNGCDEASGHCRLTFSQEVLADGPVGYWRLGEASGFAATDATGNGHDGSYSNVVLGQMGLGAQDTAGGFSGALNSKVTIPSTDALNPTRITIEVLASVASITAQARLVEKSFLSGGSASVYGLMVHQATGRAVFEVKTADGSFSVTSTTEVPLDTPTHLAATYDGAKLRIYLQGVLDGEADATGDLLAQTYPLAIGSQATRARPFDGVIDEVALYDRALSTADIARHHQALLPVPACVDDCPVLLCDTSPLCNFQFVPRTAMEIANQAAQDYLELHADRNVYWADDPVGQFLIVFMRQWAYADDAGAPSTSGWSIVVELLRTGTLVASRTLYALASPKVALQLDMHVLEAATYILRATLLRPDGTTRATAETAFSKTADRKEVPVFPAVGIPFTLAPQSALPDAVWPITTGVPLPQGLATDPGLFAVEENGVRIPAQIVSRATWHPPGHPQTSLKWLGVDFLARYDGTVGRAYRLVQLPSPSASASDLVVTESAASITVDTGVLRFRVSRQSFAGIEEVTYNGAMVLSGSGGPFVVDSFGVTYRAANNSATTVIVEEQGPVRVTLKAEGWLKNADVGASAAQLCKFVTRLTAHVGQSHLQIDQRIIINYDTNTEDRPKLADAGFAVSGLTGDSWKLGADGAALSGAATADGASIHQDKDAHFHVLANGEPTSQEGTRSDGWVSLGNATTTAALSLRDVYQKFPKELEVSSSAIVVHQWPKHGHPVYSGEEELQRHELYKLRYAHQGANLDLKFPQPYIDRLTALDNGSAPTEAGRDLTADAGWHSGAAADHLLDNAIAANAAGVAIGNAFELRFYPAGVAEAALSGRAALFQESPHALSDPEWNVASGVEGQLSARDVAGFPLMEQAMDGTFPDYFERFVKGRGEYGMWIYANTHGSWDAWRDVPVLHRLWQASHYRQVWMGWLFYFRSADPKHLAWARASSDEFMDVGTLNMDTNRGPAGAMVHAKGFVPWEDEPKVWGHWANPDAFLFRYLLTGDGRAWDLYRDWASSFKRAAPEYYEQTISRDWVTPLGELLNYYQTTWDPQAIRYIRRIANISLDGAFENAPNPGQFPVFHRQWFHRYHALTRDPQVVARMTSWVTQHYMPYSPGPDAFVYQVTDDPSHLTYVMPYVYDSLLGRYDHPDESFHGYTSFQQPHRSLPLQDLPYYMQALKDAGLAFGRGTRPVAYPSAQQTVASAVASLEVLASNPDNDNFVVHLAAIGGHDAYQAGRYTVFDPDESSLLNVPYPENPVSVEMDEVVTTTGSGLYRIECRSAGNPMACAFLRPISTLPEIMRLTKISGDEDRGVAWENRTPRYLGLDRQDWYLRGPLLTDAVTLRFHGRYGGSETPTYVLITDANGVVVVKTTILTSASARTASLSPGAGLDVVLNPVVNPAPWHLYSYGIAGPELRVLAPDFVYLGATPEVLESILSTPQ